MTNIAIKNVSSNKLKDFFQRSDIGSWQTYRINQDKIESRAYPQNKSFFMATQVFWKELTSESISQFQVDFPCRNVQNVVKSLNFFKDEQIDISMKCDAGIVVEMIMKCGDNKMKFVAGGSPAFLGDDVFKRLSDVSLSLGNFQANKEDVTKILNMFNICKTDSEDVAIQMVVEDGKVCFSSSGDENIQIGDNFEYKIPFNQKEGSEQMDGSKYDLNSTFITKMKSYDSVVDIVPKDETTKIMVFKNDFVTMVNVLIKRI